MDFVGIDKMSLVDYDDYISVTLFCEGCNFRCPFCHNGPLVNHDQNNQIIPWQEIMDYLKTRKGIIDAVVISGGEPTLYPDLPLKIKEIKQLGYLVKLDTNGTNPSMVIDLVSSKLIDYIAMDIKNSPIKYAKTAGISNLNLDKINETINFLMHSDVDYEFRTTSIFEFHTKEDYIEIGKWLKGAKKYVLQHYKDREGCLEHGFNEINKKDIDAYVDILKQYISNVEIRGY